MLGGSCMTLPLDLSIRISNAPTPEYDPATPWAIVTALSIPMFWRPPPNRPPIIPPDDAPLTPPAVPATPINNDAAMAATPTISRPRWLMALTLQHLADLVEFLLRDLTSSEPPPEDLHRAIGPGRASAERADRPERQRDQAAKEEEGDDAADHGAPRIANTAV